MTKKLNKKFGKYNVTLEVWTEGGNTPTETTYIEGHDTHSECFISHLTRAKREYTASLACALDTGELSNSLYGEIKIDPAILDDIEEWALENGY
jgi:hypothetical protein